MDNTKIQKFIMDSRAQGIPDDQILAFVKSKQAQPQQPTLAQNIVSDVQTRVGNIQDINTMRSQGQSVAQEVINSVSPKLGEKVSPLLSKLQKIKQMSGIGSSGDVATTGQLAGGINDVLGEVIGAVVPEKWKEFGANKVKDILGNAGIKTIEDYNNWAQKNPLTAKNIEGAVNIVSLLPTGKATEVAGNVALDTAGTGLKATKQLAGDIATTGGEALQSMKTSGAGQIASELVARVPRAAQRGKEALAEATVRAEKIKTASPPVKNAIMNKVDQRIINTIESADDATKKAYKEVVDIAGETTDKIGTKKQPTVVGGDLAAKQYSIIEKQKKSIGKQLGEETKKLSKTTEVPMQDSYNQIDNTLSEQGIKPIYNKEGVKLDFSGSRFTPNERTKIQELYNLATEGGDTLTPAKIREKDQLFSKLKRESQYEGIGDIIIETPEGNKSLFNVMRDIYSSKLDTLSPNIRALNAQYRKFASITDDIENSIFKTPNFEVTKSVDPAEFAKVNLRRIFGEAQSSPVYEAIADVMDSTSRGLGYKGASPKVVAEFAQEMRKVFPDTIPSTGFSGGVKIGLGDIVEKISSVGTANLTDQQKAVKELLESYFKK